MNNLLSKALSRKIDTEVEKERTAQDNNVCTFIYEQLWQEEWKKGKEVSFKQNRGIVNKKQICSKVYFARGGGVLILKTKFKEYHTNIRFFFSRCDCMMGDLWANYKKTNQMKKQQQITYIGYIVRS